METLPNQPSKVIKYGGGFIAVVIAAGLLGALFIPKRQPSPAAASEVTPQPARTIADQEIKVDTNGIAKAKAIQDGVIKAFGNRKNIDRIEAREPDANRYTYAIWYKTQPALEQVISDTKALVRATIKEVIPPGTDTRNSLTSIYAHAYMQAQGETRLQTRVFGKARYNSNTDKIEFELAK